MPTVSLRPVLGGLRRRNPDRVRTATLDLIVEYFRGRPGVEVLSTSAGQGEGSPIGFYERYGFERTGDIVFDDEVLLRLELR